MSDEELKAKIDEAVAAMDKTSYEIRAAMTEEIDVSRRIYALCHAYNSIMAIAHGEAMVEIRRRMGIQ